MWRAFEDARAGSDFNGRQGLVKLAIRILSIVVNSAGTERTFTKFGNTHTKLRNRQSADSTHKITAVQMDIERDHANARHKRPKRKFGELDISDPISSVLAATSSSVTLQEPSNEEPSHEAPFWVPVWGQGFEEDANNFRLVVDRLREYVRVANEDGDVLPMDFSFTPIPLSDLFVYPPWSSDVDSAQPNSVLGFFWSNGVRNVELEMDMHTNLCGED